MLSKFPKKSNFFERFQKKVDFLPKIFKKIHFFSKKSVGVIKISKKIEFFPKISKKVEFLAKNFKKFIFFSKKSVGVVKISNKNVTLFLELQTLTQIQNENFLTPFLADGKVDYSPPPSHVFTPQLYLVVCNTEECQSTRRST